MAKEKKMIPCKTCGAQIAANAKACPACGAKNKKPLLRRPGFWILMVLHLIIIAAAAGSGGNSSTDDGGGGNSSDDES